MDGGMSDEDVERRMFEMDERVTAAAAAAAGG